MRRKLSILFGIMVIISIFSVLFTSLTQTSYNNQDKKITVVTSFYPIYIATKNIVSDIDGVELFNLAESQTGCLHDYQITTQDMKKLENADIFIINGGGIEEFVTDILENYPDITIIDSSTGIELLPAQDEHEEEEHEEEEYEEDHEDHDHGEYNPHIWMDPSNYQKQIDNIKDGLIEYDNANEKKYMENALVYQEKIQKIEKKMDNELRDPILKNVVIFHDSFAYLAKRLGLNVIHTVNIEADTTLSAGELAKVIEEIKTNEVKVLFSEEQYSNDIPSNIGKETDSKVYAIDSLVINDGDKDSYIEGMERNIATLKKALYQ